MEILAGITAAAASIGVMQGLAGAVLVARFAAKPRVTAVEQPAVTVMKPLYGNEPLLEEALATICTQDYPAWQVVFGVQDSADPAVAVVERLKRRFPDLDLTLVIDPALHGRNLKVSNLINMLPSARHNVLVIADSDIHAAPDYLQRLMAALEQPGVGLVTTLYAGLPSNLPPSRLGATQITHGFLPGAVLARALGRQDCLGATMCLRRADLARIGGLQSLVDHLADDNVLGRRIAGLRLRVALADTVPLTTVPEASLKALFSHELRWARTIRALEPVGFAASVLQYPLAWGLLTMALAGGQHWAAALFLFLWALRVAAGMIVDQALKPHWQGDPAAALAFRCPVWLLPLRDVVSVTVMLASYASRQVEWRGHGLHADTPPPFANIEVTNSPVEGINAL